MVTHGKKDPIKCPLCAQPEPPFFYRENSFDYYKCPKCSLLFLYPQPTAANLHNHYQQYLPIAPQAVKDWGDEMAPVIAVSACFIDKLFAVPGRLLDIGCGYGFFLEAMKKKGWEVEGIELSKPAAAIAEARNCGLIHAHAVEEMSEMALFDVVTMFYVIEHVADPVAILKSIKKLLKPGGIIVLRYPNTSPLLAFSADLARKLTLMQAPSHLYDFAGDSMHRVLQQAGYGYSLTTIDANTRSPHPLKRFISCQLGRLPVWLARLSGNKILMPGYSRVTYASADKSMDCRLQKIHS
jgi:SAM-dependent methyltransferase